MIGSDSTADDETTATYVHMVAHERAETEEADVRLVRVVGNLEHPWAVEWLPDGRMLITERPGRLLLVDDGDITPLEGLPPIEATGQGGLMDVALHPEYASTGWIYFTYSEPGEDGTGTALARARLDDENARLTDQELLYGQEPRVSAGRHYGSRIAFLDDGTLVFTIGDRGERDRSQDRSDPAGMTLRLNADGSIPDDNPFVDDDTARPEVYTYGHRNAQGMAVHPETGVLWQHEHGPRGGDELNIIEPGENYGWPAATFGTEYLTRRSIGEDPAGTEDFRAPVTHWSPTSIAPSGMAVDPGGHIPAWDGNLFVGALAEQHLRRVVLDGDRVTHEEVLFEDVLDRRIRAVAVGPNKHLHILTDHADGALYRLEPTE